jgi:hypothetical protein
VSSSPTLPMPPSFSRHAAFPLQFLRTLWRLELVALSVTPSLAALLALSFWYVYDMICGARCPPMTLLVLVSLPRKSRLERQSLSISSEYPDRSTPSREMVIPTPLRLSAFCIVLSRGLYARDWAHIPGLLRGKDAPCFFGIAVSFVFSLYSLYCVYV